MKLFAYYWSDPDQHGSARPAGSLLENFYSNKNYFVTKLPEAWQLAIGAGRDSGGKWVDVRRDFAADLSRAFPGLSIEDWEVVAITIQTDSNDTRSASEVYFREMSHLAR